MIKGKLLTEQNVFICDIGIKTQFVDIYKEPLYTGDSIMDDIGLLSLIDNKYINVDTTDKSSVSQKKINEKYQRKYISYEELNKDGYYGWMKVVLNKSTNKKEEEDK